MKTLILIGIVQVVSFLVGAGIADADRRVYANEQFGFSFCYNHWEDMEVSEIGPNPNHHREFAVGIHATTPLIRVDVLTNPENRDLLDYAYDRTLFGGLYRKEEVGVTEMKVAGEKAYRLTYFQEPGTGCAVSVVFISHADRVYRIGTTCGSASLPIILKCFEFSVKRSEK